MKSIPVRRINSSQKEPDTSHAFTIRTLSSILAGKDLVQDLHRHDFYYLLVLQKAKGSHSIDFVSYDVGANTIFLMRPGQIHELRLKAGSTGYLISFQREFCKTSDQLAVKASSRNCYLFGKTDFNKLCQRFEQILHEYNRKQKGYQHVIKANLNILFVELGRTLETPAADSPHSHQQERIDRFFQLIESNFQNHKRPSDYADMLNLSLYQLNAITKNLLGKTSSEVIEDYIILEAKRSLLGTSNQITDIAEQLGYDDVSYFIRFFKKYTGHSPEVFRKNFR